MKKNAWLMFGLSLLSGGAAAAIPQIGVDPIPVMTGTTLSESTSYDAVNRVYDYTYTVSVPASATGSIREIRQDMTAPPTYYSNSVGFPLTIPYGAAGALNFNDVLYAAGTPNFPHADTSIFFGEQLPSGWMGDIDADGYGTFEVLDDSALIGPGQTVSGFVIQSPGQPTIKDVQLEPDWILDEGDGELTDDQINQAGGIEGQLIIHIQALGPSAFFPLTEDQWNQFQADVNTAIQLGWISDSTFGNSVVSQLAAARAAFDANGPAYISTQLTALQNTISGATPAQLNGNARELLSLNVAAMIAQLPVPNSQPPTPQYVPVLSLTLDSPTTNALGSTVTFTAHVADEANNNQAISGFAVSLDDTGANPNSWFGTTDAAGNFVVSYVGKNLGTDTVTLGMSCQQYAKINSKAASIPPGANCVPVADAVTFMWDGGPDLTIQSFIPPLVEWSGSGTIPVTEVTQNIGDTAAGASVTNYYLSTSNPFNWNNAQLVGGRNVPVLAPNGTSSSGVVNITLPAGLSAGRYTLRACADDTHVVAETNELNNCETNQIAVPMKNPNPTPDCTKATPSISLIWPPNHKMVDITISGITDPSNLPTTVAITTIQQDEPVNGIGDGNTAPDGAGIGTGTAQVRAERAGIAQDGRLYFIGFTATDTNQVSCTGSVTVGVPHDKGQWSSPAFVDTLNV